MPGMAKKPKPDDLLPPFPPHLLGDDKRAVILRAALTLFLRDGYSDTSMDAVTREAGVSKATVYAHFDSKQKLFETLVREGSQHALGQFPPLARRGGDPAGELLAFFGPFTDLLFRHGGYAWNRMVIAEAARHPDNAKLFHSCTIDRITGMVEHYLGELAGEGLFPPADLRLAAEAFVATVLVGPLHRTLLLGPGVVDHQAAVRFGVRLLLEHTGRPPGGGRRT
jgi:TetR/AcrR family transcriptional regulator, mexJK operon transcriptional repressor